MDNKKRSWALHKTLHLFHDKMYEKGDSRQFVKDLQEAVIIISQAMDDVEEEFRGVQRK